MIVQTLYATKVTILHDVGNSPDMKWIHPLNLTYILVKLHPFPVKISLKKIVMVYIIRVENKHNQDPWSGRQGR